MSEVIPLLIKWKSYKLYIWAIFWKRTTEIRGAKNPVYNAFLIFIFSIPSLIKLIHENVSSMWNKQDNYWFSTGQQSKSHKILYKMIGNDENNIRNFSTHIFIFL